MSEATQQSIAIVDDDGGVLDSLRFLLEVVGHSVETFGSAAEFLRANMKNLTCLILDHHMPHMTGLELAEILRVDGPAIRILLITGVASPAIFGRAAELGIKVLEKPLVEEELLDFCQFRPS
jgi:two-component system response regulator FixJ